jgi:formylmethanofuran dehydrogenase subunit E
MFKKFNQYFKKIKCNHDMTLFRWHWVHFPEYEPLSIEIEYKCQKCGSFDYIHLYGKEADDWVKGMGDYKKY